MNSASNNVPADEAGDKHLSYWGTAHLAGIIFIFVRSVGSRLNMRKQWLQSGAVEAAKNGEVIVYRNVFRNTDSWFCLWFLVIPLALHCCLANPFHLRTPHARPLASNLIRCLKHVFIIAVMGAWSIDC